MPETITVEATINAPFDAVWDGYTNPADIVQWNAASDDWRTTKATVDLRVGGDFSSRMEAKDGSFGFDFAGTYTRVEPKAALAYQIGDRAAEISFREGLGGVTVQVRFDAETTNPIEMQKAGWQAILDNFKRQMEAKSDA
jgi:uncharacterized protein YndB with AHSA1/START domain